MRRKLLKTRIWAAQGVTNYSISRAVGEAQKSGAKNKRCKRGFAQDIEDEKTVDPRSMEKSQKKGKEMR